MYRKIFIAALLCLGLHQTAWCQFATIQKAIDDCLPSSIVRWNGIGTNYLTVPGPLNGQPGETSKYYIVFAYYGIHTPTNSTIVHFYEYKFIVIENDNGTFYAAQSLSVPYIDPVTGLRKTAVPSVPSISAGISNRIFYSQSDFIAYFNNYNNLVDSLPKTASEANALAGTSSITSVNPVTKRDTSALTKDTDGGGMSDLDEIYRIPYPGSNVNNAYDDHDCVCGSCCTCECTCGYYGYPKAPPCPAGRDDCECHLYCNCGACCSCECTCGGWQDAQCDGTKTGCDCHRVCTCSACCVCECVCGDWTGESCGGGAYDCECHRVCTCGACCSCLCTCGYWQGEECGGFREDCECHRHCECAVCCVCKCTCGDWTGPQCNGTLDYCDCHTEVCECGACCQCRCTCGKWSGPACDGTTDDCACHACTCDACCQCRCICGNWDGDPCNGTAFYCGCHACTCDACCSCRCTCGQWAGNVCNGKEGSCSCHKKPDPGDKQCTCGACCRCRCICGDWTGPLCPGTPEYCACHKPIEGEDWYPTQQIKDSYQQIAEMIQEKLGVDLPALLESIEPATIETKQFSVPQIIPGVPSFSITFDFESIAANFSTVISWFRNSIKWSIVVLCLIKLLQMLFKF